jgi:hypothetical protein
MKMYFTLLELTLNQNRTQNGFILGSMKIKQLVDFMEGILSHPKMTEKGSTTQYEGLNVKDFNILLVHSKVHSLKLARILINLPTMECHLDWMTKTINYLLLSDEIMENQALLEVTLQTLMLLMSKYGLNFARISANLLISDRYIIKPNLLQHIM